MRRILILTSGYGGKTTANGLCAKSLVREMENQGKEVYVLSFDKDKQLEEKKVFSIPLDSKKKEKNKKNKVMLVVKLIKSIFLYSWTPSYDRKAVKVAYDTAMKLCQECKIDMIVSVFFPLESVVLGYKIRKAIPHVKYKIYELDSVSDGIMSGNKYKKHVLFSYKRFLSSVYNASDQVLILKCHKEHWSREHIKHIGKMQEVDLPLLKNKIQVSPHNKTDVVRFIYSGALDYSYRSPKRLVEILKEGDKCFEWSLHFFSKGCEDFLDTVSQKDNRIKCCGYVKQEILEKAIIESDVLLSIGNAVSNSLPSKIITYMTYGKPIIHFSMQENDICKEYLEKYPTTLVITVKDSKTDALSKIIRFLEQNSDKPMEFDKLCAQFPMNVPAYSVSVLLDDKEEKGDTDEK